MGPGDGVGPDVPADGEALPPVPDELPVELDWLPDVDELDVDELDEGCGDDEDLTCGWGNGTLLFWAATSAAADLVYVTIFASPFAAVMGR